MKTLWALLTLCEWKALITTGYLSQKSSNVAVYDFVDFIRNKLLNDQLSAD